MISPTDDVVGALVRPSLLDGVYAQCLKRNPGPQPIFGYRECPDDPTRMEAIPEDLEFLSQAFEYLKMGFGSRRVAEWLSARASRTLTHKGLLQRYRSEKELQRQRRAATSALPIDDAPALVAV